MKKTLLKPNLENVDNNIFEKISTLGEDLQKTYLNSLKELIKLLALNQIEEEKGYRRLRIIEDAIKIEFYINDIYEK